LELRLTEQASEMMVPYGEVKSCWSTQPAIAVSDTSATYRFRAVMRLRDIQREWRCRIFEARSVQNGRPSRLVSFEA
jgi:hypothetical protein